jgi:hypothetical protein
VNYKDFQDWKRHPVTQAVFNQLNYRIREIHEILEEQAGNNPLFDKELVGAIKAYKDVMNAEWEESKDEETQ